MADEFSGVEWLGRFLEAQGKVMAESMFMTFAIGQAGAVMAVDPVASEQMLDQIKVNQADLRRAMGELNRTVADMVANAERNIRSGKQPPPSGPWHPSG